MSHTHQLKCDSRWFAALISGAKTVELRVNDRAFMVGDVLNLNEWDDERQEYTMRRVSRVVSHIVTHHDGPWLMPGVVAMSLEPERYETWRIG